MRQLRLSSAAVLGVLLIFCAYTGYGSWKEHTPEAALAHIGHAVATEDRDGFDQYVDTDAVLAGLAEDSTELLAENIDALHARHPSDWFFRHDADEMRAFAAAYSVTVGAVRTDGDRAYADAVLHGNDSTYGRLLPTAAFTLELARMADGRWKLVRIRTAADEDGFFALVDAAERYWALQGWD